MTEDGSDLAWVAPEPAEARAEIARGEVVTHDEFKRHMLEKIEALRRG